MRNWYKKKGLRLIFIFFFAGLCNKNFAQDSSHLQISLLTCTPGEELYATFGHSALRVVDSNSLTDIVFNFGTFNFDDEGFYIKFIRGKLMYYLSAEKFENFKFDYQADNRGITEQVLNFSAVEKIALQQALYKNIRSDNKFYKYDFFLDNCTTRLRDLIVQNKSPHPTLTAVMPVNTKFRQAIHFYLDQNGKYWSKLGIDILLGAPTDAVMTVAQSQFLPEVLMNALDSTKAAGLVVSEKNLYSINKDDTLSFFTTPAVIFTALLLVVFLCSLSKNKWIAAFVQGFDGLLFFFTGVLGIILIGMWTATDHGMCRNNFNLLWALPTNALLAFFVNNKLVAVKKYFGITALFLLIVLLSWFFLPQQMNKALLPILLLLIYRSSSKYFS